MFGFRHAARTLLHTPVVTAVAILSLALAIGANVGAFNVLNALLFRTVPVPRPQDLVAIFAQAPEYADTRLPNDVIGHIFAESSLFSGVLAWQGDYPVLNLEANGVPYASTVARVAGDYFVTLGIRPYLGHFFVSSERGQVAVIDYRCWKQRFAGDPSVIGKSIAIENIPHTIIGVTPQEFTGLEVEAAPEVTVPIDLAPTGRMAVVGRLRTGITIAAARARLEALWSGLPVHPARRLRVISFATGFSFFRDQQVPTLSLLLALAGVALLIACLNVATVMLARAAARQHELGVRAALGAGRTRLLLGFLAEALLLSAAGGVLGLAFGAWAGHWLVKMLWTGILPTAIDASPDLRVFTFAVVLSLTAALLFGLAPAGAMFRITPGDALRANSRLTSSGTFARRFLAGAQIALSLALVSGALLVAHALHDSRSANLGFRRDRLLMARLFPRSGALIPERAVYYRQLAEALQRLAGVDSVAFFGNGPVAPGEMVRRFGEVDAAVDFTGPAFFRSIGVPLLAGREFAWSDDEHGPPVAIVSDALAARLFPGMSAIGRFLPIEGKSVRIVGVVAGAKLWNPRHRWPLAAYFPILQDPRVNSFWVDVRAARNPSSLAVPVRRTIQSLGRHTTLSVQTLEERLDASFSRERMAASLAAFLACLAILLASIGIYGIMRNMVARRTQEFGVRLAVGASPADLVGLMFREVGTIALVGSAAGIPLALWSARVVSTLIFGAPTVDPVALLFAAAVLAAAILAATWRPACRAAAINPLDAIRTE
jgi:predicted permease